MEDLINALTPELRERFDAGEITVHEGQGDKPVVRDAVTGQLAKGTGLAPNHNDIGAISTETAWKRTDDYASWLQNKMKIELGSTPNDKDSMEWWWERAQEAAMRSYVEVTCPKCKHEFEERTGKPDGNLIFRMIELVTGKAKQRTEIDVRSEEIYRILNEGTPVDSLEVHALTPDEVDRRKKVIESQFTDA